MKKDIETTTYSKILAKKKKYPAVVPKSVSESCYVDVLGEGDHPCYHVKPHKISVNKSIFYLYDSELCYNMKAEEWNFICEVARDVRADVYIPMYPLAPEADCQDTFDYLLPMYSKYMSGIKSDQLIMFGSGAGALMALSLTLQIWKEGLYSPSKLVLLSPVLDTEFFDEKIEERMRQIHVENKKIQDYLVSSKGFINKYWVKNYAGRTEFTSPIYADLTDIESEVLVISGTKDVYNTTARDFVNKIFNTGKKVKFFEYKDMKRNFYLNQKLESTAHMRLVMKDVLTDSRDAILNQYLYEVKQRSQWSKKFPEIFKDDHALKYVVNHKISYQKYKKQSDMYNLMACSTMSSFDREVKRFLMEYPNGTVVYLGCSLDTMFERVDNGRVLWYNLDSPGRMAVRTMYTTCNDREKIIDRSVEDMTWVEDLECEADNGLLFVFRNVFSYMTKKEVTEYVKMLYSRFRGSNIIFDVSNRWDMMYVNGFSRRNNSEYRKRRFYMNEPETEVEIWNPAFNVIRVTSVLEDVRPQKNWSNKLKIMYRIGRHLENRKLVHVRLGFEKYKTIK